MSKEQKRKLYRLGLPIILGTILLLGVSYAWFTLTLSGTKTQVIKTGKLELTLDDTASNGILLEGAYPITDQEGLKTTSYKFTIKNTGTMDSRYTVSLTDQSVTGKRIPDTAIKVWLKKGDAVIGPSLLSSLSNRILDKGVLKAGESVNYELKVWIDYDADQAAQKAEFNTKITINGEQIVPTDESCFAFDSATGTITDYKCYAGNTEGKPTITDVIVPSTINGTEVKILGSDSFRYKKLTSVIISEGITKLSSNVFQDNKIAYVELPNSLTSIGLTAFAYNNLTNIVIPQNVTEIGGGAFNVNPLTSVIIKGKSSSADFTSYGNSSGVDPFGWADGYSDADIIWEIGPTDEGCFTFITNTGTIDGYKCSAGNSYGMPTITDVVIPKTIGGVEVKSIGANAFYGSNLTSVVISNNIKTISFEAFYNNKLTKLTIPDSVTTIEFSAFRKNQLTSVVIPASVMQLQDGVFNENKLTNVVIKGKKSSVDFTTYGGSMTCSPSCSPFANSWADGYSDANIVWNG